ncbi:MAG TPA: ATP-binding protein [Phycisphaerae bacterium]|nr:ATP-binding protein [Phycisphaerae bacterium]
MFRTVNQKFYAVSAALLLLFGSWAVTLIFHFERMNQSEERKEAAGHFANITSNLEQRFWVARFWEMNLTQQSNPEADKYFGLSLEKAKRELEEVRRHDFSDRVETEVSTVSKLLAEYESDFNKLTQLKTAQQLNRTILNSEYQQLVSMVMLGNDPSLLRPLFNLAEFQQEYFAHHRPSEYEAIKVVVQSVRHRSEENAAIASRIRRHLEEYSRLLNKDYELEAAITVINRRFDGISLDLSRLLSKMSDLAIQASRAESLAATRLHQDMLHTYIVYAAITLAILLAILHTMFRRMVHPIRSLTSVVDEVREGNLDARFQSDRKDDISRLGFALNHMLETIKDNRRQLVSYQKDLEAKVTELTEAHQALERAKGDLEEANASLERRVAERTDKLVQANEQIRKAQIDLVQSEKMSMLGQLVAGVAHEINTPTSAILNVMTDLEEHIRGFWNATTRTSEFPPETNQWLASVIARQLAQPLAEHSEAGGRALRRSIEEELRRQGCENARQVAAVVVKCFGEGWRNEENLLERVQSAPVLEILEHVQALRNATEISLGSVRKIARIVKALRYYSHAGQDEMMDLNVNESLDNTLVILQNRIKHIAEVRADFADNLPFVRTGPDISQVWTNLLNNACDAIEENRPEGQLGKIGIVTRREGNEVVVEVSDDGPQIPDSVMPSIFDPFFTTKPIGKGTGLGLGICRGIIKRCGGTIAARNEKDGVTLEVRLPVSESAQQDVSSAGAGQGGEITQAEEVSR